MDSVADVLIWNVRIYNRTVGEKRMVVREKGFVFMVLVVGPILDTATLFTMSQFLNTESVLGIYLAGIPVNISQGVAVFLCVLLLTKPLMHKLNRIKNQIWDN